MRYNAGMHYLRRLSLISFAAAILLMIAMCHPPMAFFRPMKISVCAFGIVAACLFWKRGSEWRALLASAIAIIFNPVWPVYLGRANWHLADCLASLIILTCLRLYPNILATFVIKAVRSLRVRSICAYCRPQ